jgi:hypothetical protein
MDNPETLTTLYTYDTWRRQTQHRKLKRWATWTPPNPGAREGQDVPASYKTPAIKLI